MVSGADGLPTRAPVKLHRGSMSLRVLIQVWCFRCWGLKVQGLRFAATVEVSVSTLIIACAIFIFWRGFLVIIIV